MEKRNGIYQKEFNGRTDIELNDTGIKQAYITKEKLENKKIDLIICSPLKRASQTMSIITENRNIPIIYEDNLIEICYGVNEGKLRTDFDYDGFWNLIDTHKYENAENVNEFIKRVYGLLDYIKNSYNDKNILIVTHNGVCRAINTYFNGIPEDKNIINLGIKNCEVIEYEIKTD